MAVFRRFSHCNRVVLALSRSAHQEQQVNVGDMIINTVETGGGSRAALLLPGAVGSAWTDFYKQITGMPLMLPDYRLVAWDPPGCGKSSPHTDNFDCADIFLSDAKKAVDLMQTLGIRFFSVIGWGAGGTTALVMAGRFPQFIDRVAIWGATAYMSKEELKKLDAFRGKLTRDAGGTINKPLEMLYGQGRYFRMWDEYACQLSHLIAARDGDICKTEVKCIQAPTLILHGAKDPVTSKEHVNYLKKNIRQSKVFEFNDGGHDIHRTHEKLFNTTVSRFLLKKNK